MNYYLIDYENVHEDLTHYLPKTKEADELIIFYSQNCKNISLETIEMIAKRKLHLRAFRVKTGTKNALDFQLSSYIGYLIGKDPCADYSIISKDKGYDCLCEYWSEQGISVHRMTSDKPAKTPEKAPVSTPEPKKEKEKKKKSKPSDTATLEEIKRYLSNEDMPEEVLKIFNQFHTKQAICNGISKKCKNSKRAGSIYKKLRPLIKEKKKS